MAQFEVETVALDSLQPHPRNYRAHPEEQVEAIAASLKQFGQYRPIVVSSDGYILAGEGVWRGRQKAGCADIDAVRMPFAHDDPRAEKLLVADNELSRLAEDDDKVLAALLADIERTETGLAGTGWNDSELDALIGRMAAEDFGGGLGPEMISADDAEGTGSRSAAYRNPGAVIVSLGDYAAVAISNEVMKSVADGLAAMYEGSARDQLGALLDDIAAQSLHRDS